MQTQIKTSVKTKVILGIVLGSLLIGSAVAGFVLIEKKKGSTLADTYVPSGTLDTEKFPGAGGTIDPKHAPGYTSGYTSGYTPGYIWPSDKKVPGYLSGYIRPAP